MISFSKIIFCAIINEKILINFILIYSLLKMQNKINKQVLNHSLRQLLFIFI